MRRMGLRIACSMVFFLLTGAGSRRRLGDPEKGEKVFDKCNACHALDKVRNKIGPHLVGIFGRAAGSIEPFKYSEPLKGSGIIWRTTPSLAILEDPNAHIFGNRRAFLSLKDEELADLVVLPL